MKLSSKPYRPQSIIPNGGRLIQAFKDTDMRCGYDGLKEHAKKEGKIDLAELTPGEYVAFFNTACNIVKLACANHVVASRKLDSGRYYDLTCIRGIVEAFQITGKIDYEPVLQKRLEELLGKKRKTAQ